MNKNVWRCDFFFLPLIYFWLFVPKSLGDLGEILAINLQKWSPLESLYMAGVFFVYDFDCRFFGWSAGAGFFKTQNSFLRICFWKPTETLIQHPDPHVNCTFHWNRCRHEDPSADNFHKSFHRLPLSKYLSSISFISFINLIHLRSFISSTMTMNKNPPAFLVLHQKLTWQ